MRKRSKHQSEQNEPTDPIQPSAGDSAGDSASDSVETSRVWEIEDVSEEDLLSDDEALSPNEQRIAELENRLGATGTGSETAEDSEV